MPDLQCEHVQGLLHFLCSNRGLAARVVLKRDYDSLCRDNVIPHTCIDFGIYGEQLLYQSESYEPFTVGLWSSDSALVERFTHFFDNLWKTHTIALPNPIRQPNRSLSIEELMAIDENYLAGGLSELA
jgi:hypothetical protein